jgi:3',5'-cyclic AMP phosphodiesterase CpdA
MDFITDPPIAVKIQKMAQRVRWQHPLIQQRGIDQTELVLENGKADKSEFSFLVIGDSGSGSHRGHSPQRKIAELMLQQSQDCRFVLHTGDVIYLVGSSDYYLRNFIDPYREFLVGGEQPRRIRFDQITFKLPFFLVPGNHDYYDLPLFYGLLAQTAAPLRYLLRSRLDLDVGWRGSQQGKVYAQAFLDYMLGIENPAQLAQHLDQHYSATGTAGRCLRYQPEAFTRMPNRYYQFRYGGIDFFALDSNTFNAPIPLSDDAAGEARRRQLEQRRTEVQQEQQQLLQQAMQFNLNDPLEAEQSDDCRTKLEQLEEIEKDIDKQLRGDSSREEVDTEQLDWLKQRLIESWHSDDVRGRILFFHHPPYVTEATKWHQGQTLAVRYRLRAVLDQVMAAVGERRQNRPLVDLVLNGHAHCLEYLRTGNTGHGDAQINWIVCGGSGYSLRRQRSEGAELPEVNPDGLPADLTLTAPSSAGAIVAKSQLFVGRTGQGYHKHRPYSFLRIDVQDGTPPRFVVRPFVAERYRNQWHEQTLSPIQL